MPYFSIIFFSSSFNFADKYCSQLCLLRITEQYRDVFYQSFHGGSTWCDSQGQDLLTSGQIKSSKAFPSVCKKLKIPPLKYPKKLNQFHRLCKTRILLVCFIIFQTLFSKGIVTFVGPLSQCWVLLLMKVNSLPKTGLAHYHHCVQRQETLQVHNLK